MVTLDAHHRRIHFSARLIHFGLMPLALVVPVLWIYFAYGVCQDSESKFVNLSCSLSHAVPLFPALVGIVILGVIGWELVRIGIKHHEKVHQVTVRQPKLKHAIDGYNTVPPRHRWHIHMALAQVILVSVALTSWLFYEIYRSTH